VYGFVADFARTAPIGELQIKGFSRPILAYAVQGYLDGAARPRRV
jgi:hypothetical protein